MKNPLISVIIPVYNVESYIEKCFNSVTNQTYSNIEIIFINDGSIDSSGEICDAIAQLDKRVKVIHKSNDGLSDARNAGIEYARGEYLVFVDSDDYIHPQMIQILYEGIVKFQADISVCNFLKSDINDKEDCRQYTDVKWIVMENDSDKVKYVLGDETHIIFTVAWNKLYKKELFSNIRYPYGKLYEDEFTTYKLLHAASKIVYTQLPLYYYVQRQNSIMRNTWSEKNLEVFEAFIERLELYKSQEKHDWYCALLKIYRWRIMHCWSKKKQCHNSQYVKKLREYKRYYNVAVLSHLRMISDDKMNCLKYLIVVFIPDVCIMIKDYNVEEG